MNRNISCLRCGTVMSYAFTENTQLGKAGILFGVWPNIAAGAIPTEVYCCPSCGKLEFFTVQSSDTSLEDLPQTTCPVCGRQHDFDYPSCPFCKHTY